MRIMAYRKEIGIVKKICLIIISLILRACHTTPQLEGTWKCEKSPLENKDIYTVRIEKTTTKDDDDSDNEEVTDEEFVEAINDLF